MLSCQYKKNDYIIRTFLGLLTLTILTMDYFVYEDLYVIHCSSNIRNLGNDFRRNNKE